ncbi:MAG: PadR family transcriptional regulator [Gemmatimonadetes bacterium]|nr:PadR family transcriptional regulator [Gemmatimonadota bacterium]
MGDDNLGLLRGTLDLLILKALATGEKHGYAVSEWIEAATDGSLLVEEGTLYPALHRLARKRLIGATWGVSENNRRAKYYTLTAAGQKQLEEETTTWRRYSDAVEKALAEGGAG